MSTDGERLVRSALNELIEKGYVKRETLRGDGKIKGVKYTIINLKGGGKECQILNLVTKLILN